MRLISTYLPFILLLALLHGCAGSWQALGITDTSLTETYRQRARDFEIQGELRKALLAWRIVSQIDQEDAEALEAIRKLQNQTIQAAREHFQNGLSHYQAGDYPKAQREFLTTLRHRPGHKKARYYLKTRLQNKEKAIYQVKSGDSFNRIATKIYNDPSKAYMVAHFNALDPGKPLLIGTTLLLPSLDPRYLQPRANINALLERAQRAYDKKRYADVHALTSKIQEEIPGHPKARQLADAAHFDKGSALLKQKRYPAAVEQFKRVSPSHKGRDQAIAKARSQIKQLAVEEKLQEAQDHLRNNEWQSVINVTEEILAHDPDNAQAKMLFSNASYNLGKVMLDRGKTAQAVKLLNRIDPAYEDTGQLIDLASAQMRSRADSRYRDGVKHFINDDLESAIEAWNDTLRLNPQHPKARQDIENVERLLNKLKALETQGENKPKEGAPQ